MLSPVYPVYTYQQIYKVRCIGTDSWWLWEGRDLGALGEKGDRMRNTDLWLQSSHRDVTQSTGNTVNNTVVTMYGVRWLRDISGEYFVKNMIV